MLLEHIARLLERLPDLAAESVGSCAVDVFVDRLTLRHDRWNEWVPWNYRHLLNSFEAGSGKREA